MAGSAPRTPARIVLPASALLLAGMAWRVGWIDGSTLDTDLICEMLPLVGLLVMVVVSLIMLLSPTVLLLLLVRNLARRVRQHRRDRQPTPAPWGMP